MTSTRDIPRIIVSIATVAVTVASLYFLFRPESPSPTKQVVVPTEGGLGLSNDEEKEMFIPSSEWKPVKDSHICPAGLEYRLDLSDGSKFARLIS